MSYEKVIGVLTEESLDALAIKARDDLYGIFDRGIELQMYGTAKGPKEDAEEVLGNFRIDGFLKEGSLKKKSSYALKLKIIFALVEALSKFSIELFEKSNDGNFIGTYMELRKRYLQGDPIPDDFLRRTDFLAVFKDRLKQYPD